MKNTFTLLGSRLTLTGPTPPEDALWLAASIPTLPYGTRVLDAGTGTGIAALALLTRQPHLNLTGVEINPEHAAFATQNASLNHLPLQIHTADILTFQAEPFPLVISNPPFHATARGHSTPNPQKALAHSMPDNFLTHWLLALHRLTAPTGSIHLILHAACLKELTSFAQTANAALTVIPLQTSSKNPPKRLLAVLNPSIPYTLTTLPPLPTYNKPLREKVLQNAHPLPPLTI